MTTSDLEKNKGVQLACGDLYVFQLPNGITLIGELSGTDKDMGLISIFKPYQIAMQGPTPQSKGQPTYTLAPRLIGDPLKTGFITIVSLVGLTIEEPSSEFKAAYTQARTGIMPAKSLGDVRMNGKLMA